MNQNIVKKQTTGSRTAKSIKELSLLYNVSTDTIKRRLRKIPDLNYQPGTKLLFPKQLNIIFAELGEP